MNYVIPPQTVADKFNWCYWDGLFTNNELDYLQEIAQSSTTPAVVGKGDYIESIRRSEVTWVNCDHENMWLFDKLGEKVSYINSRFYNFDITGFGERLQFTNYDEKNNGHYNWHIDAGQGISRKISLVVQLSHPNSYDGGELELFTSGEPEKIPKKRGFITFFPSFTLHRVTPVTRGTRQTLVCWITGAPFR